MRKRKWLRRVLWSALIIFIIMNVVAFVHAWKFTHYSAPGAERTKESRLSSWGKVKTVFTGVNNPRPVNACFPAQPYQTIHPDSDPSLECWMIKAPEPKGVVVLFHGYAGEKSGLLDKAGLFREMGYSTLLVDFHGSGGSGGNGTTIGYKESSDVAAVFNYLQSSHEKNIILFGTSMGAAAVMKAVSEGAVSPSSIIIECPFSTLYRTVCNRFTKIHVPHFPMAGLLVFWGGVQNGFWAFDHQPVLYAKKVHCPALLFYGSKDQKVSIDEINEIYANLRGKKELVVFPKAGHENYLVQYKDKWMKATSSFLDTYTEKTIHLYKIDEPAPFLMAYNEN